MSKVYTKKGDRGKTGLLGGGRIFKDDIKIESYGDVDELNAHLGYVRDLIDLGYASSDEYGSKVPEDLFTIQKNLFTISSWLSLNDVKQAETFQLKSIQEQDVEFLEERMDQMSKDLSPLKNFILPGGHPTVSATHIARTVCRRSERSIVRLSREEEIDPILIKYVNRLSDYLFILCRYLSFSFNVDEVLIK